MSSAVCDMRPNARVAKRAFDLVVASGCLLLLSPVLLALALSIGCTSRGGALFRQNRVGRNGRPFVMYKFRTMLAGCSDRAHREYVRTLLTEDNPPAGGATGLYKLESDSRVTPIGRFIRRKSLDELPQLLNVFLGNMSLVGPRPALAYEAELFSAEHSARLSVPPGVTGLWQISGRNKLTMRQGLDLDLEYLERQGFVFDLQILLKTIPAVLSSTGAR